MKISFIGGGNMASALIGGLVARGQAAKDIHVIDPSEPARVQVSKHGVSVHEAASESLLTQTVCVLAVKPQVMRNVCLALAPLLKDSLVISVAAGIRAQDMSRWLGDYARIVRAMPNTPALIGQGVTGLYGDCSDADKSSAQQVLEAVGKVVWVDSESGLDAVTAVSGSGPAYVFRWMEAMLNAGTQLGLKPEQVKTLVEQTVRGAAELAMQSDDPVSTLRERVTSPNGTTAAGLDAMNAADIEQAITAGINAAHARSVTLGDEFGKD